MTKKENKEQQAEPAEKPAAEVSPPFITVTDIQNVTAIINIASERGAFKANELTLVGATYDKFVHFLEYMEQQAKKSTDIDGEDNDTN